MAEILDFGYPQNTETESLKTYITTEGVKSERKMVRSGPSAAHITLRFTGGYIKQVEGVVCTGGVCRYEFVFSGVKLSINSTF